MIKLTRTDGDAVRRVGVRRRMGPDRRRRPGSGTGVSRTRARRGRPCPAPARQNATRLPADRPMTAERHLPPRRRYALRRRLASLHPLVPAQGSRPRPRSPAPGPAGGRPLPRRFGFGAPCPGQKAERGAHDRAAALGHRLELRPARPAARPRRSAHRRSDERHPARHGRPPDQKEAVFAEDLIRMIATLAHDLRGLRDRAILLIGFAGGLRRSEITGLDCGPEQTEEGAGWIEFLDQGILIRVRGKTG
jgi:integrase